MVPLREGGSLPAILDTDGGGIFVAKFRGAGQGARALIAELIVGGLAHAAELPLPELALIMIDPSFGRSEPDPEIQDILKGSHGVNVGMRFIERAFTFDPVAVTSLDPALAADVVWLDAFTTNIDRTPRNPNILYRSDGIWLIDHGAALYFHHNWSGLTDATVDSPFAPIRDHVLLPFSGEIAEADERMRARLHKDVIVEVVESVPDELLMDAPAGTLPPFATPQENREAYIDYLVRRLTGPRSFVTEAINARRTKLDETPIEQRYRR